MQNGEARHARERRLLYPEEKFKEKAICVTGKVEEFRGTPQIVVTEAKQIVTKPAK